MDVGEDEDAHLGRRLEVGGWRLEGNCRWSMVDGQLSVVEDGSWWGEDDCKL
jgi:hypothetical protein